MVTGVGDFDTGRQSDWDSFQDFEQAWHSTLGYKYPIARPSKDSMYWDGQFDEVPYILWDRMEE